MANLGLGWVVDAFFVFICVVCLLDEGIFEKRERSVANFKKMLTLIYEQKET